MAKEVTVFQKGDVRVVNIPGSESFYVEEWIEEDGEWIEHIEESTRDKDEAIATAKAIAAEKAVK